MDSTCVGTVLLIARSCGMTYLGDKCVFELGLLLGWPCFNQLNRTSLRALCHKPFAGLLLRDEACVRVVRATL